MAQSIKASSHWRNFMSWAAVGGVFYVGALVIGSALRHGAPFEGLVRVAGDPKIWLVLLGTMGLMGLAMRRIALGWSSLRNFVIWSAFAGVIATIAMAWVRPLAAVGRFGAMGVSEWTAAAMGLLLLYVTAAVSISLAASRRGLALLEPEKVEMLRERGALFTTSWMAMAATGLLLVLLSLSGPGSVIPAAAALAGVAALVVLKIALSRKAWRMMDELDRTLARESGMMGLYGIMLLGGGWAMLAQLGFVRAPAALDWVTMMIVINFAASFVAVGRRKLLPG